MNASVDLARAPAPCAEPAGNQRTGCFGEGVRKAWRRLAWWLLPLLLLAIVLSGQGTESIEAYRVGQVMSSACVPDEGEGWRVATLPITLRGDCHYLRWAIDQTGLEVAGAGLMLVGLHEDAAVHVNGVRVRDLPELTGQSFYSALLWMPIGSGVLQPGSDEVLIELRSQPTANSRVGLRAAFLGPEEALRHHYERLLWLQQGGARLSLALIFAVLLFLLPITFRQSADRRHRWFTLALLGAALYVTHFATSLRPFGLEAWNLFQHAGLALSLWATLHFSAAVMDRPPPRGADYACAVALLLLAIRHAPGISGDAAMWLMSGYRLLLLGLLLTLARLWWAGRHLELQPGPRWFAAAAMLLALLGTLDATRAILRPVFPFQGYVLHWGILYLTLLMFAVLLFELLRALDRARAAERDLAAALAQRSAELEAEFGRRQEAESAHTLAEERQRIMRDMHDGVGGQLVALIAQVEAGQTAAPVLAGHLRRNLEDLRLMIDSLDPACADLSVALGMLRERLAPLLSGLPIAIHWRTAHLPDLPAVPPSTVLHVLRVVQEALTNALKHARARTITIAAQWDARDLVISVSDDGDGLRAEPAAGRGIASMQARAAAIGGELRVDPGNPGTVVTLRVPLPAHS